jgi:hypothetical protein
MNMSCSTLVLSKTSKLTKHQRAFGHFRVICCHPATSSGVYSSRKRTLLGDPVVVKVQGLTKAQWEAVLYARSHKVHRVSILDVVGNTVEEFDSTAVEV